MTSGRFQSIPISSITIPSERQRRELTAIDELAKSITASGGLIHPIVVTPDHVLVAGHRRLSACTRLGWTHIPAQLTTDLDPIALQLIELEENVKRVDLPWQDHTLAVQRYHKLMLETSREWTQFDTANALGISQPLISRFLLVAGEIAKGNEAVLAAPRYSVAQGLAERKASREASSSLSNLRKSVASVSEPNKAPTDIQCASFLEWAPNYCGTRFNFIHCDFPYGIGAGTFDQSGASAHGTYDDSREAAQALLRCFAAHLDKFCAQSAHIMFWFSMKNYAELLEFFELETDFKMQYIPLVWSKHLGIISDPGRTFRNCCEFALFGTRGDRKIVRTAANHYHGVSPDREHMSEKPVPMLKHFFGALVDHTTIMLDPTCGSGTALCAAHTLGAAQVTGLEINKEYAEVGNAALEKARREKKT